MRLIDADAYKKYLDENWIVANYDAIDAQPTIDAVEVVRCENCIWHDQEHPSTVFYNSFFCKLWLIFSKPDHFCANGIRRKK